ncbi:unnamed protein product, partial [marine sediment metagenome]
ETEDSYFEVDLGGHLTFVNSSVCHNLGYSRKELIGMSYKNFTLKDDIESVFRTFNKVYRTGKPNKGFPWKIMHKDGSHGFAETSVSPLRNDKDEIIGFRGVGRDITERKRAEEVLKTERNKLQSLINAMEDGLTIQDRDYTIIYQNEPLKEIFGDQLGEKCYRIYEGREKGKVPILEPVIGKGKLVAEATSLARDMVNEPANYMTPSQMVEAAKEIASKYNLELKVFD